MLRCQAGESGTALPEQGVLLAFVLGDLAATAGKHQNRFVVAHQLARGLRCPDHSARGGEEFTGRPAHVAEVPVGQRPHPGADHPPYEVGDQYCLGTSLGVVAHQQESPIGRQVRQPVDIWPTEVDNWCGPVGDDLHRTAQHPYLAGLIHDRVDVHRGGHDGAVSVGSGLLTTATSCRAGRRPGRPGASSRSPDPLPSPRPHVSSSRSFVAVECVRLYRTN